MAWKIRREDSGPLKSVSSDGRNEFSMAAQADYIPWPGDNCSRDKRMLQPRSTFPRDEHVKAGNNVSREL